MRERCIFGQVGEHRISKGQVDFEIHFTCKSSTHYNIKSRPTEYVQATRKISVVRALAKKLEEEEEAKF